MLKNIITVVEDIKLQNWFKRNNRITTLMGNSLHKHCTEPHKYVAGNTYQSNLIKKTYSCKMAIGWLDVCIITLE